LPTVSEVAELNARITGATIASPPVLQFTLTDERGVGVTGLQGSNLRATIAKLEDGTNGNSSAWQSYINRISEAGEGPNTEDQLQGYRERGDAEGAELIDNGDGTYQYTYATDVMNVTDPIEVTYDENLTHRVGLEFRGLGLRVINPTYTFRPSDGATVGIFSRQMINDDSCNACHNQIAFHGNGRFTNDYCVTCHNPGTGDPYSGNTVDHKVFIHKIHRGASLPAIVNGNLGDEYNLEGTTYAINVGPGETEGVIFPQDIRNCRNCHDETDESTPDAINWIAKPTIEACGSCHDDVNFATGENHFQSAPPVTNAECQNCHGEGEFASADKVHALLAQEEAKKFQYNVISATGTGPGEFPVVTFSITDPTNEDAPYDIQNDAPFTQGAGASRIAIDIGWNTVDYTNDGSGSGNPGFRPGSPAQVVSLNPLFGGSTDNMDGTFTITSGVMVPMDQEGSLAVAVEGHPAVDVDNSGSADRLPVTGEVAYFGIDDDPAVARREVVSLDSCNNCHQQLSLHGNNRTDKIELCVTCHNADATDIRARTEFLEDPDNVGQPVADGKKEEVIDFKHMIHAIHAGQVAIYGFGGGLHDYRGVEFPGDLNNCANCHDGDSFYPVNQNFVLATTIDSGADLTVSTDDVNISPNASACYGCHRSDGAQSHMVLNGASFNATQAADGTITDNDTLGTVVESCEVCHDEGRSADVGVAHGVN
jgi:OmcA/MtrC family decaheme c-type cytochrome